MFFRHHVVHYQLQSPVHCDVSLTVQCRVLRGCKHKVCIGSSGPIVNAMLDEQQSW